MNCDPCPKCGGVMGECACARWGLPGATMHSPIYESVPGAGPVANLLLAIQRLTVDNHLEPRVTIPLGVYRMLVMGALQAEAISMSRAAELLGLTAEEMRALELAGGGKE